MRRRLWFLARLALVILALTRAGHPAFQDRARRSLDAVKEVRPVRLEKSVSIWRYGKVSEAQDLVLIRVTIASASEFLGRGIGPPLFLLDDSVCLVVAGPLGRGGEAVLLAPRPDAGRMPVLWLSPPGLRPQELDERATQAWRQRATAPGSTRSLPVPQPPAATRPTVYQDLSEVQKEFAPRGRD